MTAINYEQAEQILNQIPQFTQKNGYERAADLLSLLENPEKKLKIIHVAGSNGKGSVCAYLNQILIEQGFKTGLFTSPHLFDMRERIRINNKMIEKQDFVSLFEKLYKLSPKLEARGTKLAYFDYFLGIALEWFAKENVDYVLLETGLGGKLDATNAVECPVLSVITTISLEHTAVLGDSIEKIAGEKAGIIKKSVPVVFSAKDDTVSQVIYKKSQEIQSGKVVAVEQKNYQILKNTPKRIDFFIHNEYYKNNCFSLSTNAVYQAENCSLALTAAALLAETQNIELNHEALEHAVYNTHWAGRMEEVSPLVYVDGAHNPEGIASFIESAKAICSRKKSILLFSVVKDKNFEQMIQMLTKSALFDCYIVVQLQSLRHLDGDNIKNIFEKYTTAPVYEYDSVSEGFKYARRIQTENTDCTLMCTGSLYLVGEIAAVLRKEENNDRF